MDPLSVLGLVSNVVQLVDAAAKAYTVCHQIYKDGAAIEDSHMAYTTNQLSDCYSTLSDSLKSNAANGPKVLRSGVDLSDLGSQCLDTAEKLQTELQWLRKDPAGGVRETARKFISKKRKSRTIKELKSRLDEFQKVLDSKILVDIRQGLGTLGSQSEEHYLKLQQQLSKLSADLASCHMPVSKKLTAEIAKAIKANEEQHILTRQHAERHIASAVQDLKVFQDQHRSEERKERVSRQQHELFLMSLTFEEINLRMNEVKSSHPKTFEWMFDDNIKRPWNSFVKWLRGDERIYWINGKAGSGKSTLMKFLANDARTERLLAQWSPNPDVLIVKYFFWLSGSRMQRSLKGLLCSVVRQIVLGDKKLVEKSIHRDETLLMKRSIHDWSDGDLRQVLRLLTDLMIRPICIFMDGLDEFDQRDDIDSLLSFIEELSKADKTKVCVSSRPENYIVNRLSLYNQIRLQDLTADDMQICIRHELRRVCEKYPRASLSETQFNATVKIMIQKADGVFLWVHYALSSLTRGIRNEDDFNDLLNRIEQLPDGMQQLYLQMWKRLNGDEQLYHDEAATYFSYMDFLPVSLFEMLVALNTPLQESYIQNFVPQDPGDIARDCERLKTWISSRCAGLLEVEMIEDEDSEDGDSEDGDSEDGDSEKLLQEDNPLIAYHKTKIRLLHRTARDFLMSTKDGQGLLGDPGTTLDSRFQNVTRAQIAALVQGLTNFDGDWMHSKIKKIGNFGAKHEQELLTTIRRLGQRFSIPGPPKHDMGYRSFWTNVFPGEGSDFENTAAFWGCADYIRHYIQSEKRYFSPYYRGLLTLSAAQWRPSCNTSKKLSLTSWLVAQKADIHTRHYVRGVVYRPASKILLSVLQSRVLGDMKLAQQAAETILLVLPSLATSTDPCLVRVNRTKNWLVSYESSAFYFPDNNDMNLLVSMSLIKLCLLVMQQFEKLAASKPRWSRPTIPMEDNTTEVVFCGDSSRMSVQGSCPNNKDSVYLGQALECIWFRDETSNEPLSNLTKDLEARLKDVCQRSKKSTLNGWMTEAGWCVDLLRHSIYGLDPSEDVDESNWFEKGHFRHPRLSTRIGNPKSLKEWIGENGDDSALIARSKREWGDSSSAENDE